MSYCYAFTHRFEKKSTIVLFECCVFLKKKKNVVQKLITKIYTDSLWFKQSGSQKYNCDIVLFVKREKDVIAKSTCAAVLFDLYI